MSVLLLLFAAVNFAFALGLVYVLCGDGPPERGQYGAPFGAVVWCCVAAVLFILAVVNRFQ